MHLQRPSESRTMKREADRLVAALGQPVQSRRDLLRRCLFGGAGLMLLDGWGLRTLAATRPARATSVIQIWMWGGPAHLDTFDPKPEAGYDYCGPLDRPLATNVAGIRIGQLLPQLAKHADKYAIVRSLTHGNNGHETASYIVQTGQSPGGRDVFPSAGAVVSLFRGYDAGYQGLIPPYIVLTQPQGRFSEAGFLGTRYKPFATGGDPAKTPFAVEGVVAPGITEKRQHTRRTLLERLNTLGQSLHGHASLNPFYASQHQAYELILGDAGKLFDLSTENEALRDRYGRNTFGQSCLMARRLVEKGVPYITINYKGWDTHKQHFQIMNRKLPELDQGMATLLEDLSDRGLLATTLVWWSGEFGRTPKIQWDAPWNGGRNHYGQVFSAVLAGGGFRGGHVIGSSTPRGEEVQERPVHPAEVIAGIYELVGIDPHATLPHPQGNVIRAMPVNTQRPTTPGRLFEIMPAPTKA
jgi:hypothetical protein